MIDYKHPDFGYNVLEGDPSSKVRGGYDFVSGTDLYDMVLADTNTWHGTECAGIIGAIRNNEEGIAGIAGGDYQGNTSPGQPNYFDDKGISLYSLGIWDYAGPGVSLPQPIQSVYDAIVTASLHPSHGGMGLDILNNSWRYNASALSGVADTNYILLKESLMFANRNNVSVVAGRGNAGSQNPYNIVYPACMDDDWIMNVGGTGEKGVFPATGTGTYFLFPDHLPMIGNEVDFAAPADPSLIYTTSSTLGPLNSDDKPYSSFQQTSASAPHVSGAVGLLMSYLNGNIQSNSTLAPEDGERILELTAENYDNMGQYSDSVGWGKINLGAAFRLVEQPYNTLHHLGAVSKELHFVSNSNIYIREPVQNDNNIWFTHGTYNANVHRLDGWRNHAHLFNDEDTIVEYWARPSRSDVFEELDNDSLLPRHRVTIDYLDKDSCHLHGYIYEILDGGGNTIGWLPNDTTLTKWNTLRLSYTILMRDSTAPTLNVEEFNKDQHVLLYPNPSSNIQTVKFTGFSNQDAKITLYDIQGRSLGVVHEGKLEDDTVLEFNVSGHFNFPVDFDPSQNEYLIEPDAQEMYIAKYDNEGNFLWVKTTQTQGSSQTFVEDLAICNQTNRITVSGIFTGNVDVNPDENESHVLSTEAFHVPHAYITTYDLDGEFIWATDFYVFNVTGDSREYHVDYDETGNLFLCGQFADTLQLDNSEVIPPLFSFSNESNEHDIFLAKFNPTGDLEWVTGLQGESRNNSRGLVTSNDYVLLSGHTNKTMTVISSDKEDSISFEFNPRPRPFIAKYNAQNGDLDWAFDLKIDNVSAGATFVNVDINSNVYISGFFIDYGEGYIDFDPSSDEHKIYHNSSNQEAFLAKYSSDGAFAWAFSTPGGVFTEPRALQVLSDDRVVLAGSYRGSVDVSGYGSGDSISTNFTSSINHHVFMGVYKQGMLSTNEVTAKEGIFHFIPTLPQINISLSFLVIKGKTQKLRYMIYRGVL